MKKLIIVILVLAPALVFINCQSTENKAQEDLKKEVFVIHDDVMPKTSEINRLQRKLRKLSKDIPSLDDSTRQRISDVQLQLEKAHDGMMVWMNNFKSPAKLRASKSHEEIMQYLEEEKIKITQVRDDMLRSIESGNSLLDDLENKN
jgi:MFS superfamily sulfate permease-like transporter